MSNATGANNPGRLSGGIRRLVPHDYPTIQAGINASFDGDTVLISEGTYYEQIRYLGKAITLGSLYLVDGDTTHISRTIIDGSHSTKPDSGSVVYFLDGEDTTSVLCGLTIQGGTGTRHYYAFGVWYRLGGGIYCCESTARLFRNIIRGNGCTDTLCSGGGLVAIAESPTTFVILEGNTFSANYLNASYPWTDWQVKGAGASIRVSARIVRNIFEQDTIIAANYAGGGGLIFAQMSTGQYGYLPSGTIKENIFRHNVCDGLSIGQGAGLMVQNVQAATISCNVFESNVAHSLNGGGGGAAIYVEESPVIISENYVVDNISIGGWWGAGAIKINASSFLLQNNVVTGNYASLAGGGLDVYDPPFSGSGQTVLNNTFVGNRSGSFGGAMSLGNGAHAVILNNIFWGDTSVNGPEIYEGSGRADLRYCDVAGGYEGDGNLSVDPEFIPGTVQLNDSSLCIGSGIGSVQINGSLYTAPASDYSGLPRPSPPGSWPDLGARENPLAVGLGRPSLRFTPLFHDFCTVRLGTSSDTLDIVIANKSTSQITISSISHRKAEYALIQPPTLPLNLPSFEVAHLKGIFAPISSGLVVIDSLVFAINDPHLPTASVTLRGRGSLQPLPAQPGILYGVGTSLVEQSLFEVDRKSGAAARNARFSPDPPDLISALTFRPRDSTLYGAIPFAGRTDLYRLSSQFGDLEFAFSLPIRRVTAMAFNGSDALYFVTDQGRMYRVREPWSDTAFIGNATTAFSGLAFSPSTGELWGSAHDSIYRVDCFTAGSALVGARLRGIAHSSIAFGPAGTLYGLFDNALVALDRSTGEAFHIGSTGASGLRFISMRIELTSGVEDHGQSPLRFELSQNFPNPFNPSTAISYQLSAVSFVTLRVFDILGREVAVLVNERKSPGAYTVSFNATQLASGVYFYRLNAGTYAETRKMILMR